jgi:hypothetical protein
MLAYFNPYLSTKVKTDLSDYLNTDALSQQQIDSVWRLVAFYFKRLIPAERSYAIYDKELPAIIHAFEKWRTELESCQFSIQVLTDHENLRYYMSVQKLSR